MVLRNGIPPWTRWASLAILALFAAGCRQHPLQTQKHSGPSANLAAQAAPSTPVSNAAPNELGRVLVLEYHQIGDHEARWTRTPENFRKDLETLYKHGFRAVS
ncbi:MAG TPA: hypothetical protein VHR86_05235, partial [Armatimonadota bacterium]|nr:hypothetical protein [Armatimonadota bacterium]